MARSRNIKPGFFQNDLLAEVHPLGRLLFAALWTLADREGRLEERTKKIKAQALPYDECDIDSLLNDLGSRGFILRYVVGGSNYIQITKWHKHQQPHVKEAPSTIPAPCESGANTVLEPGQHQTGMGQEPLIPDPFNLIPDPLSLDSQKNLDQEEISTSGPDVPGAPGPVPGAKTEKSTKTIRTTALKPESKECWGFILEEFPKKGPRQWDDLKKEWFQEPISKGSLFQGEQNFQAIVDAGIATPYELYGAFHAYITEEPKVKKGFVQQLCTFFGTGKSTWTEWLERGREITKEAS